MKKIILALIIPFSLHAQSDSLKVTFSEEKVEQFEKTTLIDEYEKAFGGNREVKSGLRMFVADPGINNRIFSGLQYEQKITPSISLIGSLGSVFQIAGPSNIAVNGELRYYYKMRKRIASGLQKANINGNYLSFKIQFYNNPLLFRDFTNYYILAATPSQVSFENGFLALNLGRQFGNVLNLNLMLGLKRSYTLGLFNSFKEPMSNHLFISSNNQIGLGLLFPKQNKIASNYCEFLRCNYKMKNLFKINVNNAFYFDKDIQKLKLDLAFETKVFNSRISLNSNVILDISNIRSNYFNGFKDTLITDINGNKSLLKTPIFSDKTESQTSYIITVKEQLRYYINSKKSNYRNNNLMGLYTGLEYGYNIFGRGAVDHFPISTNRVSMYSFSSILGYQTLTNKKSFLDVNLAFGLENIGNLSRSIIPNYRINQVHFEFAIKLGLAK